MLAGYQGLPWNVGPSEVYVFPRSKERVLSPKKSL